MVQPNSALIRYLCSMHPIRLMSTAYKRPLILLPTYIERGGSAFPSNTNNRYSRVHASDHCTCGKTNGWKRARAPIVRFLFRHVTTADVYPTHIPVPSLARVACVAIRHARWFDNVLGTCRGRPRTSPNSDFRSYPLNAIFLDNWMVFEL